MSRRLLMAGGGGSFTVPEPPPPGDWQIDGAAAIDTELAVVYAGAAINVTVDSVLQETGFAPDFGHTYNALWTRDHAYTLWHNPTLLTAAQRRQFVTYTLSRRTDGLGADPANFIADRIDTAGGATYKNAGPALPFMDGIHFVILVLWTDWNLTGDLTTFTASRTVIDDCLAALPRSVNGCVYSDPSAPSVDYGFTDTVLKTGDLTYGTALQAWAYKMMAEMNGEAGSGTYTTLRSAAESGLATLRQPDGWYAGSSGNNSGVDDVWATALIVAEELVSGADRTASAQAIIDAYESGSAGDYGWVSPITQFGLVRHLPVGQTWTGTPTAAGSYQNGGYWLTPLWDCVRAVDLIDPVLAREWAADAIGFCNVEFAATGSWTAVPWEWHNYGAGLGVRGYTASAAVIKRFV